MTTAVPHPQAHLLPQSSTGAEVAASVIGIGAHAGSMVHRWGLRRPTPTGLVHPVPVDPEGRHGPTPGLARSGSWRRTAKGLYVPAAVDASLPEQRIVEAGARIKGSGGAVTGWAALLLHGGNHFDGLGARMQQLPVPVVLPLPRDIGRCPEICKLRAPIDADEVVVRHGIPVTVPVRALRDHMTHAPDARTAAVSASIACSAGLVAIDSLRSHLAGLVAISGVVKAREAMAYVDDRVRSPPEARLFQAMLLDAGLPRPLMNWPVYDSEGTYLGSPDGLCVELGIAGEYDSEDHDEDESRDVDAGRDVRFRSAGLTIFRIGKRTLADPRLRVERIMRSVAVAQQSQIPRRFVLGSDPEPVVAKELREMRRLGIAY